MSTKDQLKKAKEAISAKDFVKAKDLCKRILMFDSNQYTALIYLGVAHQNLGQFEDSEEVYRKAITLSPNQTLAYQGLVSLFEKSDQFNKLCEAYTEARQIYVISENPAKILEMTKKLIEIYSQDPSQLDSRLEAMRSLLPGGTYYHWVLKCETRPKALELLNEIADLEQERDKKLIAKEVESRRRRISDDSMATIRAKVRTEVYQRSKYLDTIYALIELRDDMDEESWQDFNVRYLNFHLELILQTYVEQKSELISRLLQRAHSLIKDENCHLALAYEVIINFQNVTSPEEYEKELLQEYLDRFQDGNLAPLAAYLLDSSCKDIPVWSEELSFSSIGIISLHTHAWHRLDHKEYDLALSLSKILIEFIKEAGCNAEMEKIIESCRICAAFCYLRVDTGLRAMAYSIFHDISSKNHIHLKALEGLAEYAILINNLDLAEDSLTRGLSLEPLNTSLLSMRGWVYVLRGEPEEALIPLQKAISLCSTSALALYRLGRAYWAMGGEYCSDKQYSYAFFLKAAQVDPTLGAPFIFLGHFYRSIGDFLRALKCYTKAVQLDPTIPEAHVALYEQKISNGDLSGANSVLEVATKHLPTNSWAWGKLGFVQLANRDFVSSISSFQSALKADSKNSIYWEGLGEAYLEAGRYLASLKAYQRAENLAEGGSSSAEYHMARLQLLLGNYKEAILLLQKPIDVTLYKVPCLKLLADSHYQHAQLSHREGAYGSISGHITQALAALVQLLLIDDKVCSAWELAGDILLLARLTTVQVLTIDHCPAKNLISILPTNAALNINFENWVEGYLALSAACFWMGLKFLPMPELIGVFLFKAGLAHQALSLYQPAHPLKNSLRMIKCSINQDPTNPSSWNLLGVVTMRNWPIASQHAFAQALFLNPRDPSPYTNLGFLCLMHSDFELAAQAFDKALHLQPEFGPTWVGRAILALVNHAPNAEEIISHAITLNEAISSQLWLAYATKIFQSSKRENYHQGLFSLQKFTEVFPRHYSALNLLSAYLEQTGSLRAAAEVLDVAQQELISQHQMLGTKNTPPTQISKVLESFVRVQINHGRILTGLGEFSQAVAAFDAARGGVDKLKAPISEKDYIQLQVGLGAAHFHSNNLPAAMQAFESALILSSSAPPNIQRQVALQLAQVLWFMGGQNHRELAKQQLMGCIRNNTHTIGIMLALLVMGLVLKDDKMTYAVSSELLKISPHIQAKDDPDQQLDQVLAYANLIKGDKNSASSYLAKAIYKLPHKAEPYLHFIDYMTSFQGQSSIAAHKIISLCNSGLHIAILQPSHSSLLSSGDLISKLHNALSVGFSSIESMAEAELSAQRAIMAAPWSYYQSCRSP